MIKKILGVSFAYSILYILITFSKQLSEGVKSGLSICMNMLIPSLFLFMIVSNIIANTKLAKALAIPFAPLSYLFKIDKELVICLVLGLIGGYPVSAMIIAEYVRQGRLSKEDASRVICYSVNCGVGFLINGVGINIFNNAKIGMFIYISNIIAMLIVGIIMRKATLKPCNNTYKKRLSDVVVDSVTTSVKAMAVMCGFVLAFCAICMLVPKEFSGLLEVTTGCFNSINYKSAIMLCTLYTAFGGMSVHLQIASILKGIELKKYFLTRIIYVGVSLVSMFIFSKLFSDYVSCYNGNKSAIRVYSVSPISTIFLIALSIMLLICNKNKEKNIV